MIKLSLIKNNQSNPRIIKDESFRKLVQSIKDFPEMMEKRPIVIDSWDNPIILGGNMRFKAIQEAGYKEIPESWISTADGWTDEQKKEFIIKDNISGGEWDWDQLANEWDTELLSDWGLDIPNYAEEDKEEENDLGIYPLSIILNSFEYKKFQLYKKENHIKSDTDAFKELFNAKKQ